MSKNTDFPIYVKRKVFESAFLSAILYSCEAWVSRTFGEIEVMYMEAVKNLLGVRRTTPNLVCLAEIGFPDCRTRIKSAQKRLITNLIQSRRGLEDDPFWFVWKLCEEGNTKAYQYFTSLLDADIRPIGTVHTQLRNKRGTKFELYTSVINPALEVHRIYVDPSLDYPHHKRVYFTRLRTSAHSLTVEMG